MSFKTKNCEFGRSMIEMLGVLAIIGVISVGGMAGYGAAVRKYRIGATKDAVIDALKRFGDLRNEGFEYYQIEGADAAEEVKEAGFIQPCDLTTSAISEGSGYQVCRLPLGEQYVKVVPMFDGFAYSYMYFATLVPADTEACIAILSSNWDEIIPEDWWSGGRLWIGSEIGRLDIYGSIATITPTSIETYKASSKRTIAEISRDCARICHNSLHSCTIAFDFVGYN